MPDPTGRISHLPDMHRGVAWKEPVRVATNSNVAPTGISAGNAIDGVTLASGDRVLAKNQTAASSNGIYLAGAAGTWPLRAFDMDQYAGSSVPASEVMGAVVQVVAGSSNGGTFWRTTNTSDPTIGTTAINWLHMPMGGGGGAAAAAASNHLLSHWGGQDQTQTIAASGSSQTLTLFNGNVFDITLTAACTFTFANPPSSGVGAAWTFVLRQGGSGSYTVSWPASVKWQASDGTMTGTAPTLHTAVGAVDTVVLTTVDGGTTYGGLLVGSGSSSTITSPLTTKGDIWAWGSNNARFAVGSNGTAIIADSTATLGIRYTLAAVSGELLMQDGVSAPPVPLESDPGQDDWLYGDM